MHVLKVKESTATDSGRPRLIRFLMHLVEMMLAMGVGMVAFHVLFGKVARESDSVLRQIAMALFMLVPMVGWMLVRGHGWRRSAEMAAAMLGPMAAIVAISRIASGSYPPWLAHVHFPAMGLGMVGTMLWRRQHYLRHGARASAAGGSAGRTEPANAPAGPPAAESPEVVLRITGMDCPSCKGVLEKAIGKLPGIDSVEVNFATERAQVRGAVDLQEIRNTVEQAGFGIAVESIGGLR